MNASKDSSHSEPTLIGDIITEIVDPQARKIDIDPVAEHEREQRVAELLADTLAQTRSGLIEQRQAGEPVDAEDIRVIGEELLEAKARSEELKRQIPEDPRP